MSAAASTQEAPPVAAAASTAADEAATTAAASTAATGPGPAFNRRTSMSGQIADSLLMRVISEISLSGGLSLASVVEFPDEECLIVRLSPDRSLWAVGLTNGKVQLFRTDTGALAYSLDPSDRREKQTVTGLVFVPSELLHEQPQPQQRPELRHMLLASYATGQVRMWHYAGVINQQLLWTLTEERATDGVADTHGRKAGGSNKGASSGKSNNNHILCLACSTDGQRFVTGGADGAIRVYDTRRRAVVNLCQSSLSVSRIDGHRNRVCALAYHPLGRQRPAEFGHLFVSGGWDNTIHIWDDRRPRSLWVYFGPHVCGSDAIDIDPLQGHILTGSWERQKSMLQVWKFNDDAASGRLDLDDKMVQEEMLKSRPLGELQQDPTGTPSMGYVAQWLGTQYMAFGGSNSNVLKIVDRVSLNIVAGVVNLPKGVYSLAVMQPDQADTRRTHRLAFCAGNRLYVMKFERKP